MINFKKVSQVFKAWESLIKVNEEFKAAVKIKTVENTKGKKCYSIEVCVCGGDNKEPQGTDANYH